MEYNSQEIAARIKGMAKQKGIRLRQLHADCKLGINTVSGIAKGKDIMALNLAKLADALDCSVDYLLGRTDNPEINR